MAGVIKIVNGPNLNLLGTREPEVYGSQTLDDIMDAAAKRAKELGFAVDAVQSNSEGEVIDAVQSVVSGGAVGLIINPGGYSHTSVAIRDAVAAVNCPVIEVHLSNIYAREEFRHHSLVSAVATGTICGLGAQGYQRAIEALAEILKK